MLKKIELKDAVGTKLAHDLTEIRPGEFKGAAFHKGHTVCDDDLCHLQKMGKNHLYAIDLEEDEIHEDRAAAILADALAGDGIVWKDEPREGKIKLLAGKDGLFNVDTAALAAFNMVDEVMCATLHTHTLVKKGEKVAATRAIPLVMKRVPIERAAAIARQNGAVLAVKTLREARVGMVITGNEVFHGLIEDRFAPILSDKVTALGSKINAITFAPDDEELITLVFRFMNSYLRATLNAKNVRTAYNVLNQYRQLVEAMLRSGHGDIAVEAVGYMKYYGHISYDMKIPFVTETVAYDDLVADPRGNFLMVKEMPDGAFHTKIVDRSRSEERRVGKECRSRWSPYH